MEQRFSDARRQLIRDITDALLEIVDDANNGDQQAKDIRKFFGPARVKNHIDPAHAQMSSLRLFLRLLQNRDLDGLNQYFTEAPPKQSALRKKSPPRPLY